VRFSFITRNLKRDTSVGILEVHQDHENLLYLTDDEATLQVINKWIGGGAKLSLTRSPDGDVLKTIIIKLQKREWAD
jgi:hypothetical protein